MARIGFCSGFYTLQNISADAQTCMEFFPEAVESQMGKSAMVLNPTPGLSLFSTIPGQQVRGELAINSRGFAVVDAQLYEVLGNGTFNPLGAVANDGNMCTLAASPQQLAVTSGGNLYVFYLQAIGAVAAGTFTRIPSPTFPGPVSAIGIADDDFIALIASSQQFFVSQSLDATVWPPLQTKIISTFSDNVVSMQVDHRQIYLLGGKASEIEYDSGNVPVPFDTAPGGFIEEGSAAQAATVQLDNSIFFLGARNDLGWGIARRLNGYTPVRISTFAVEYAWSQYPTIADARAWVYQDGGHSFWVINFPSAPNGGATWAYDVATGIWAQRGFWFAQGGVYQMALPQCHMFQFGKHLVGDRKSGNIYQMASPTFTGGSWNFVTHNNNPIRRVRRAPYISAEGQWQRHHWLWVDMETGLGPIPPLLDGAGEPRDPMATLRYSDDGAHRWSSGEDKGYGQAGNYRTRVIWRRLGRSRGRVYELSCSDPVPMRIVDAYLFADGSNVPQKRLPKQMAEVS